MMLELAKAKIEILEGLSRIPGLPKETCGTLAAGAKEIEGLLPAGTTTENRDPAKGIAEHIS